MPWAARRRFIILLILGIVFVAFLSVVLISTLTKTPSCSDGISNQEESGVDCGGPCPYLCNADLQPPTVLFTKALSPEAGRTDVVALIENKNPRAAAKNVPYTLSLFGSGQNLLQETKGFVDIPPGTTVPVYVSHIASGKQVAARAFLSIAPDAPKWYAFAREGYLVPRVIKTSQGGTETNPRIEATLENENPIPFFQTPLVALVRDTEGNIIAASQTVVPSLDAQGEATALFTWNTGFSVLPVVIEVLPVIPLK